MTLPGQTCSILAHSAAASMARGMLSLQSMNTHVRDPKEAVSSDPDQATKDGTLASVILATSAAALLFFVSLVSPGYRDGAPLGSVAEAEIEAPSAVGDPDLRFASELDEEPEV